MSKFRITGLCLVLFDVNRGVHIFLYQTLAQQDSILVVITFPGHKSDQRIFTECHLSALCGSSVCKDIILFHTVPLENNWTLVHTVPLVAPCKFNYIVNVFAAVRVSAHNDFCAGRFLHHSIVFRNDTYTGVKGCLGFHTGSHHRCLCGKQRNGLTLHVGPHQCTVRIVIFKERDH